MVYKRNRIYCISLNYSSGHVKAVGIPEHIRTLVILHMRRANRVPPSSCYTTPALLKFPVDPFR